MKTHIIFLHLSAFIISLFYSTFTVAGDRPECRGDDQVSGVINDIKADSTARMYVTATGGVWISCDQGESWTRPEYYSQQAVNILIDRFDESQIYYSTYNLGLYKSTDYGQTFSNISGSSVLTGNILSLYQLNRDSLLAGSNYGIFKSDDQGVTWSLIHKIDIRQNIVRIISHPNNPTTLFAVQQNVGIYQSLDNGQNWTFLKHSSSYPHVNDVIFSPFDSNNMYSANSAGVLQSIDQANSWQMLQRVNAYKIIFSTIDPNDAFVVTFSDGIYRSVDGGQSWSPINDGFELLPRFLEIFMLPSGRLFAGTQLEGLYVSDDNGETWAFSGPEYDNSNPNPIIYNEPPPKTVNASISASVESKSGDSVSAGKNAKFIITVKNSGPEDSLDVLVDVAWFYQTFTQGKKYQSYTMEPSKGSCTVTCNLGSLKNDETVTIKFLGETAKNQLEYYTLYVYIGAKSKEMNYMAEAGIGASITLAESDSSASLNTVMLLLLLFITFARNVKFAFNTAFPHHTVIQTQPSSFPQQPSSFPQQPSSFPTCSGIHKFQ